MLLLAPFESIHPGSLRWSCSWRKSFYFCLLASYSYQELPLSPTSMRVQSQIVNNLESPIAMEMRQGMGRKENEQR